jgi:hypothetical protein
MSLSMDRIAKLDIRGWTICDSKYVLTSFNSEKLRSQDATLTHNVRNMRSRTMIFGNISANPHLAIHFNRSSIVPSTTFSFCTTFFGV